MRRALFLVCALFAGACAARNPVASDMRPDWLMSLIRQLEGQPVANPPAFIARYDFRREIVYYLPARCCDIPSTLYRADGTVLCHPDGGFSGRGDGQCPTFFSERANEQII